MNFKNFPNLIFTSSTISDGNMSFMRGNKPATYANRQAFLGKLNIADKPVIGMSLVHGNDIKVVQNNDLNHGILDGKYYLECDGLITNKKAVYLLMLTADCLPTAFFDPKNQVIALVHVSRHNLLTGIIKDCVEKLVKEFKTNPSDLVVKIGPSIGPCCYKADKTTAKRFTEPQIQSYILESDSQLGLDLWQWAEDELTKCGVQKANIENTKICTYHSNKYFSHVKFTKENLEHDYRFATILGIKDVN